MSASGIETQGHKEIKLPSDHWLYYRHFQQTGQKVSHRKQVVVITNPAWNGGLCQ